MVVLPLAAPTLRPLAKTAIKSGILAYWGATGLAEGIGDVVAEAIAEGGGEVATRAVEGATQATGTARPRRITRPAVIGRVGSQGTSRPRSATGSALGFLG